MKSMQWVRIAAAVSSVAVALPAPAAEFKASTWADSQATGTGGLVDNPPPDTDAAEGTTPGVSANSSSGASLTNLWYAGSAAWDGTGNASATADTSGLHLYAAGSAEVIDAQPSFSQATRGDGIADGEFTDVFVLQANGIPAGTFLRARAELVIDSLLTVSASDPSYSTLDEVFGSAGWIATVRVRANGVTQYENTFRSADCYHRLLVSPTPICPANSSARPTIVFSVPVGGQAEVLVRGNVQAGGLLVIETGGYASAGGTANLSNTIGWGGVFDLKTLDEEPVTDFSMISETTGIDYRYAQVPEPADGALGLVAIAAIGLRSRRRPARCVFGNPARTSGRSCASRHANFS